MYSKFFWLLLATHQVVNSIQWERPHIQYFSRWDKLRHPDTDETSRVSYGRSRHHCSSRNEIKPVNEDQQDVPRRDSFLTDEDSSDHSRVSLHGRPRHDDCEIFVNPIRPPYDDGIVKHGRPRHDDCEIFVNPIRPPYDESSDEHGRPRHDDCEIFVNPIRPPYQGPIIQPIEDRSSHFGRQTDSESLSEEYQSGAESGDITNFRSVSGRLSDQDVQSSIANSAINEQINRAAKLTDLNLPSSIANSAINEQIGTAALRVDASPENELVPASGPIVVLPFLPSGEELPIIQPSPFSPALPPIALPSPTFCIRHRLVPVPVRVVDECITQVPVVRKTVRHQVETITRHVPVVQKTVTQQNEKIVRHVPVSGKTLRNVVETRVRHIPVIRSRTRTIVEPYTVHVPVTIRFTRPVEESITKTVPVQEVRTRPVITQRTRLVPVLGRRIRPVVEQRVINVPVKKNYLRTVIEQRVRPVVGPCGSCSLPPQPIGLPLALTPRILLSPYSDISGSGEAPVALNQQFGATLPGGQASSGNTFLPGPINTQSSGPSDVHPINVSQAPRLSLNVRPNAQLIIPNILHPNCSPPPPPSPSC